MFFVVNQRFLRPGGFSLGYVLVSYGRVRGVIDSSWFTDIREFRGFFAWFKKNPPSPSIFPVEPLFRRLTIATNCKFPLPLLRDGPSFLAPPLLFLAFSHPSSYPPLLSVSILFTVEPILLALAFPTVSSMCMPHSVPSFPPPLTCFLRLAPFLDCCSFFNPWFWRFF